jgi:hypothetical protein
MWKRLWQAFKAFSRKVGNFQARIILTVFYGILVLPFGLAARLFSDPLRIKRLPTNWVDHPSESTDLQWARRQ